MVHISYYWSRSFLTSRFMLWSLFWINLSGTIYGYEWYWRQMTVTVQEKPLWMVLFVPDSPTASLFFTLSLVFLLLDARSLRTRNHSSVLRGLIETVAVVTSVKYGVWAVSMIFAGAFKGDPTSWQDWMLTVSHLGMAVEALLYVRFFQIRWPYLLLTACWILGNDYIDYHFTVFPWLPESLYGVLDGIRLFTIGLSLISLIIFSVIRNFIANQRV